VGSGCIPILVVTLMADPCNTGDGYSLLACHTTMLVTEAVSATGLSAMRGVYEIDCHRNQARSVSRLALDRAGRPLARENSERLGWSRVVPGSFAMIVQAATCAGKMPEDAFDLGKLDPQVVSTAYFQGGG
jgi:hypothetical protein